MYSDKEDEEDEEDDEEEDEEDDEKEDKEEEFVSKCKPNSLSRGPIPGLLCVVGEDYTPTLQDLTWC